MKKEFLCIILKFARCIGLFRAARWLTRHDLRILAYHGAALDDEDHFRGRLFINPERFRRRLEFLADARYPVLELPIAIEQLETGVLPHCATVITIDDGWSGTAIEMAPALHKHGFPATLYIATYYMDKQTQVFNVAVDYVLWRTAPHLLDMSILGQTLEGLYNTGLPAERETASNVLWSFADTLPSAEARQALLRKVCTVVGLDASAIEKSRVLSFMTRDEARTIQEWDIDLQLHTHRHRFPSNDFQMAMHEIEDNRQALDGLAANPLTHFCYPSGEYEAHQLGWLEKCGITSASTTKNGFNRRGIGRLELRRFLDSEFVSDIEFEAEMSGFLDLIRRFRSII